MTDKSHSAEASTVRCIGAKGVITMGGHSLIAMLLLCLCAVAVAADAPQPSFACVRAATPAEHAICAHPELARGDAAIARTYRAALARLDADSATALKSDHRDFLVLRDTLLDDDRSVREAGLPACDAIADLAAVQQERVDFLDAVAVTPAEIIVGTWKNLSGEISVKRATEDTFAVHLNAAEPSSGRWVCDFTGHGKAAGEGRVVVTPDDGEARRRRYVASVRR